MRKFASHPHIILTGVTSIILICLLTAIFPINFTSQTSAAYAAITSNPGQAIFEEKCTGCHSIGGGRMVGPDLKGVTERREQDWLIRFIVSPEQLIAQDDPIAEQLVQEYGILMPNLGLSQPEVEEILAYIEAQSGDTQSPPSPENDAGKATPVPIEDTAMGRDIFIGKIPLQNGGAACISCHNVSGIGTFGGGTVGKDLTKAYSTFGEQGITSILKTTPFPLMKEIYTEQPLTDGEIAYLRVFLQEASRSGEPTPTQSPLIFIMISVAGLLLIIGIFQLLWRGRLSGVRRPMVKGGSK